MNSDEQVRQAQAQLAQQEHAATVEKLVEMGRADTPEFDDLCARVADNIGTENMGGLASVLVNMDAPTAILRHLDEHPAELQALKSMNPVRAAQALGRIEQRLAPHLATGNLSERNPAWRTQPKSRSVDAILSDDSASDKAWEAAFRRKHGGTAFVPERFRR
jgi:hypothetical protein